MDSLAQVHDEVVGCRRCPRLVAWRELAAATKRRAYKDWDYWGRPVPGFGDPDAKLLIVGLAPAAHGGNRTGRAFTGDRSGDFLFASLWRCGYANQAESVSRDDGLDLTGCWVTAAVKCAPPQNRPTTTERDQCRPYLERELELLGGIRVVVSLGLFGWDAVCRHYGLRPKPRFGHGTEVALPDGRTLIGSYHVSQQNTFTGKLSPAMLDAIWKRARVLSAR